VGGGGGGGGRGGKGGGGGGGELTEERCEERRVPILTETARLIQGSNGPLDAAAAATHNYAAATYKYAAATHCNSAESAGGGGTVPVGVRNKSVSVPQGKHASGGGVCPPPPPPR